MDTKLSHTDQYKMLREEIMQHMRDEDRTGFWGITMAGVIYGWLITHKAGLPDAAWYISPCVILFCGLRLIMLANRVSIIAEYLRRIEEKAFQEDAGLPGWERYFARRISKFRVFTPIVSSIIFWTLLLICSILASRLLSLLN